LDILGVISTIHQNLSEKKSSDQLPNEIIIYIFLVGLEKSDNEFGYPSGGGY
jgi:hypothetical protein